MCIMKLIIFTLTTWTLVACHLYSPNHYQLRYGSHPFYNSYNPYGNQFNPYTSYVPVFDNYYYPNAQLPLVPLPGDYQNLNVLAEMPYSINNTFTVVPMVVVAQEDINFLSNALIIQVSREKPTMTVKNEQDALIECTPAVKILLDKPLIIYSLRTSIIFPTDITIEHKGFKIPIHVGAVLAPLPQDTYVSPETPINVNVVYAVPTKPFIIDYVNNDKDVIINIDNQAVILEEQIPPKNITVLEFPTAVAEPTFQVDEEDEELVNRNPPVGVVPAGIVQSTQPIVSTQQFINSKESPVLTALREEAAKNRLSTPLDVVQAV
ncbi:hypothetical protein RI129_004585 [Pyrocoelia pectoralis]|uniref:Uncharacterized protein n=1 Tax=Pyrocoelia pectoralis TaxID=417401 RepID=A0AAN7VIH8_9COLE